LLKIYFPFYGSTEILFYNIFQLSNLDKLEKLSENDLKLVNPLSTIFYIIYTDRFRFQLKFTVRSVNEPPKDAIIYIRFIILDLIIILKYKFHNPINIFVDYNTFNNLESPVNLHIYYYNELVARTEIEFADY
jgi:hypothetical protein